MSSIQTTSVRPFFNFYTQGALLAMAFVLFSFVLQAAEDKTGFYNLYILMILQLTPFVIAVTRKHFTYLSLVLINHFLSFSFSKYNQVRSLSKMSALQLLTQI